MTKQIKPIKTKKNYYVYDKSSDYFKHFEAPINSYFIDLEVHVKFMYNGLTSNNYYVFSQGIEELIWNS